MKIILTLIISLLVVIFLVSVYFGAFKRLGFQVMLQGGETVVYEEIKGDYRQSAAVMDKIYYSLLENYQITTYRGFGIYYDNPRIVEKSKLRSEAGTIIEAGDHARLGSLPLKIKSLPQKEYVITEFPYKGKFSVFFGLMKVYPALNRYMEAHFPGREGPVTEIYDVPAGKIIYRMELK